MFFESTRFTGAGVEIKPGARSPHHSNLEKLSFRFWAVCDGLDPETWHGEVWFGSSVLLRTEEVRSFQAAGRLAEAAFQERVVEVFGA